VNLELSEIDYQHDEADRGPGPLHNYSECRTLEFGDNEIPIFKIQPEVTDYSHLI
jgi:hypothetical protein